MHITLMTLPNSFSHSQNVYCVILQKFTVQTLTKQQGNLFNPLKHLDCPQNMRSIAGQPH